MNQQQTPKPLTGPYRATRLWNEAIRIFNNGVPCKRHWRQLRQYENCFTATEATSWLHTQLRANPNFGPNVSKDQVQQLLCKFLKAGVFEDVRGGETKVENFKDNSGLYRLTNRSPFRNPRTPGRTPLGTISNRGNNQAQNGDSGSPKLPRAGAKIYDQCDKTLVQCHLTARQLNQGEVEDIWKTSTLRQVAKALGLFNLKEHLDPSQIKGKWVLWNVTRIGVRGVVQSMEEIDSPPPWVLYGMKSLVNWPANENHKLPDYRGSERDVFKVICDYFTNASGPLTTFSLYNLLVEAFIRAEAADLQFRKAGGIKDEAEEEEERTLSSRSDSVQSLVMKMTSPACRKTSTPLGYLQSHHHPTKTDCGYPLVPVMIKSPIQVHRTRSCRPASVAPQQKGSDVKRVLSERLGSVGFPKVKERDDDTSCCYETAFTTAEPQTRMIVRQSRLLTLSRRSQSSDLILEELVEASNGKLDPRQRHSEVYRSLDRLRSKSGGYVNVAAFGSADCLQQINHEEKNYTSPICNFSEWRHAELWTPSTASIRSISSLSSHHRTMITGLSPPSALVAPNSTDADENWGRHFGTSLTDDSPTGGAMDGQQHLRSYRNSPSKRLVGRRKGLEFYYGAKACRPGLVTIEGKTMAVESLQLLTLLLPPDLRRKLHLLLRFMAKVSSNTQLVLNPGIPLKTLMINTFYRCIVCSSDESDYDELLAVRLVTFLMENAEAVMVVPHRLCVQVRDTLLDLQREKIRFQPDDAFPLAFCRQVSSERFQQQKETESGQAVRQLLEHIVADQKMTMRDRRKRLKQFRMAYPEIYYNKFPEQRPKEGQDKPETAGRPAMMKRIRNLRLI